MRRVLLLYILYITLIIISSIFFGYLFSNKFDVMDNNNKIILENIPFEFGELISNLFNSNGYFHTVDGDTTKTKKQNAVFDQKHKLDNVFTLEVTYNICSARLKHNQ